LLTSRQPAMRAVSGGKHSLNLQMSYINENIKQVNPALRLPAKRYAPFIKA